jgi:uridylate kinase
LNGFISILANFLKKILLKVSGEFLESLPEYKGVSKVIKFVQDLQESGCSVAIVVGGGNIVRGEKAKCELPRRDVDQIGMLATIINGLALESLLTKASINTSHYSSIQIDGVVDRNNVNTSRQMFQSGNVVIFSGGLGVGYFSTDTVAVLRAIELGCDCVFKMSTVEGIFDKDPSNCDKAEFIHNISYDDVIFRNLRVMDMTAIALARDNNMPLYVFSGDVNASDLINKQCKFSRVFH